MKNDDLQTYRISGRCKLTQEAIDEIESTTNKSAFYAEAINFFVSHGRSIDQRLKIMDAKLDEIKALKVVMEKQEITAEVINQESVEEITNSDAEVEETEESKRMREEAFAMTNFFLNFNPEGGGE